MSINTVMIPRWFDRHLHIRTGKMLQTVFPHTLRQRPTGAVIMGNLEEPYQTSSIENTLVYRREILRAMPSDADFIPCMTCYLTDQISPSEVVQGFAQGAWRAVKLYMTDQNSQGGTTGSHRGVKNLRERYPVFEAMQKLKIPLLGHFEAVEEIVDEFDREIVSVDRDLIPILNTFPDLPVVFEHITDSRVADLVATGEYSNLYATVTAHHLIINRNAMFFGGMNSLYYCKPVPKRESHRLKIRQYVTSGNPRFGAGTDSAPHPESAKSRSCGCAAGIFSAPIAVELYTMVFDQDGKLENLGKFLSENFVNLYGMEISKEAMTLKRETTYVPEKIGSVNVFKGGYILPWTLL